MTIQEALDTFETIGVVSSNSIDQAQLAAALETAADHSYRTKTNLAMAGVDGAPDWLGFEMYLWKLSERLRPLFKVRKDWRSGSEILKSMVSVCQRREFGKGRQNFVLLIGDFGGVAESNELGVLLNDSNVQGHVIKALVKQRNTRFQDKVANTIPALSGWTKSVAKKYVALNRDNP